MRPFRTLTLVFLLFAFAAAAQHDSRIEAQKKVIAALEGLGCTVWRISDMEDLKARLKADGI